MVTMKNALLKDTFREIRRNLSRFLSIFAIVALGVSFFAGVKATCPDMKITADKYFDDYRLMDIKLASTMGFSKEDIDVIKKVLEVEGVLPAYSMDALVNVENKDLVLKVLSLPIDKVNNPDESYINRVKLVEGRYPEKPGECVTERVKMLNSGMSIGSKIKLSSGNSKDIGESLNVSEYTIVGVVETPYYISFERGTSSIGNGKVNSFIMIPQENFKIPVYTDVFLTVKGARDLFTYGDQYEEVVKPVKKKLEDIGKDRVQIRYHEVVTEANKKLSESKEKIKEAEEKQKTELKSAAEKLNNSKAQIEAAERQLQDKENQYNKTFKEAETKLAKGYKKLGDGEKEYSLQLKKFNDGKIEAEKELSNAEDKIQDAQKQIDNQEAQLKAIKDILALNQNLSAAERAEMEAKVKLGEQQLAAAKANITAAKVELETKKKEFYNAEVKLTSTRNMLVSSKKQLDSEKKKLDEYKRKAEGEFAEAHRKLDSSKAGLEKGLKDYEKGKRESDEKISKGYAEIADAERELIKIKEPIWYVLDRNMHIDFVDYEKASDRIASIAQVFPVFFFLIAALVCLTTMTRMVDEQRTYIGTLKALGYSKIAIASKYLVYAVLASASGSIFGVILGFKIFPTVIFNAYGIMYTLPPIITEFNVFYATLATSFAVLSTTLAAWVACYKELVETPSILMRPKSPKAGKRIFLEKIKFLWNRLNFTQKVTARNLLRYKKRFLMTILGIGGCTALLLAGFGLKDSIVSIVSKQFDELYKYHMVINLNEGVTLESSTGITNNLSKEKQISDYIFVNEKSIDVGVGKNEKSVSLYVPEDTKKIENFIIFRNRTTKEKLSLDNEGVILTEKLAKIFQVKVGDQIYIKDKDTEKINVKVLGITENYLSHYVYMSPKLYESIYGKKIKFQQLIAKTTDTKEDSQDKLSKDLLRNKDISSVVFTTGISNDFKKMLGSLDYVILVLIVSAGALAFVVLYNLTNVNVTERLREIATIKVLGFYDNEVSTYVYRENFLLTIIGMTLGLFMGIFLHRFIIVTSEIDYVMFGRNIKPLSYLYSAILTIVFSGIVNFVMYFKLKKIGMVESLKSVD